MRRPARSVSAYRDRHGVDDLIETRPGVRSGKPCFIGTRITVDDVLEYVASGMTAEEIVADFPELDVERVEAALVFDGRRRPREHGGQDEARS